MQNAELTPRRAFFKQSAKATLLLGVGAPLLTSLFQSFDAAAQTAPMQGVPQPSSELAFRQGLAGPTEVSRQASQLATTKATNRNAKEFAGFELNETIAMSTVLKDMATPTPPMDAKMTALIAQLNAAAPGPEFDRAYIQAQIQNHQLMRDLTQNYLKNATGKAGMAETHGRHLATLALSNFKEHTAITTRILGELS